MRRATILLVVSTVVVHSSAANEGMIDGIVVNATRGQTPVGGATVVLQVREQGQFIPAAETVANTQGVFRFEDLPTGENWLYLPGANQDDVHYPGPRVRLTARQPHVHIKLAVFDCVSQPNPLLIRQHEIVVRPRPGAIHVTETLLVENSSSTCYVGQVAHEGAEPVTLQLAIPVDFVRTTFEKEFFGRAFSLVDGKLVTGIPWPPGKRQLRFTYVIPNEKGHFSWQRPLDLPCSHVRLTVQTNCPDEVTCNLHPRPGGQDDGVTFESAPNELPAGYVLRLQLGRLPVPMMVYGRWISLMILVGLTAGVGIVTVRRRRRTLGPRSAQWQDGSVAGRGNVRE